MKIIKISLLIICTLLLGACSVFDIVPILPSEPPVKSDLYIVPLELDEWLKVNTGKREKTDEGIKVYGAGVREGHQGFKSKNHYNFLDSQTFIKWKADGGDEQYAAFWIFLMSDYDSEKASNSGLVRGGFFTTHHTYKSSVLIKDNTWFYTRIRVFASGKYEAVTATDKYDSLGGTPIYKGEGTYENAENGQIVVVFQDNYAGTKTNLVLGQVKTTLKIVKPSEEVKKAE